MSSPLRRPVTVEIRRPTSAAGSSTPSSPTKNVRFPAQGNIITGVSRPLSTTELYSLGYFESHARTCPTCMEVVRGGRLCSLGNDLAKDVMEHVYYRDGQIYSRTREKSRNIRVEIPPEYDRLVALLRDVDRDSRSRRRRRQQEQQEHNTRPIIEYDIISSSRRASFVQMPPQQPYLQAYALPGDLRRDKTIRYNTIIVGDDEEVYDRSKPLIRTERRGSLYANANSTTQLPKEYMIEVIEPSNARRRGRRKDVYA